MTENQRLVLECSAALRRMERDFSSSTSRTFDEVMSDEWNATLANYRGQLKRKRYIDRAVWFSLGWAGGTAAISAVVALMISVA